VQEWYFPTEPLPFLATILQSFGREAASTFVWLSLALGLGALLGRLPELREPLRRVFARFAWVALPLVGFVGATAITWGPYQQLPHVVDAVAYQFQAKLFAAGQLYLQTPPYVAQLDELLQITKGGRWYAQYPPGTALVYAVGWLLGAAWLVGPIMALVMVLALAWATKSLYGARTGLAALALGSLSPFILFQAGSFLSHVVSGAFLALSLAAFVYGERVQRARWHAATGVMLGFAFLCREAAGVAFALPLVLWLLWDRQWKRIFVLGLAGLPFLAGYLAYNAALTGSPFLLPRTVYQPADTLGFAADGPFQHTLAAGLVNTDLNLTLLGLDLSGWPPLATFSLLLCPFFLRKPGRRELLLGGGALLMMAAYIPYAAHGIELGPRYYLDTLPWLIPAAARGLQCVAQAVNGLGLKRVSGAAGAAAVAVLLTVPSLTFYLPRTLERRLDYGAVDGLSRVPLDFVEPSLSGPRLRGIPAQSLVLVPDGRVAKTVRSMNCALLDTAHIQQCPVLFIDAGPDPDVREMKTTFPGRTVLYAVRAQASQRIVIRTCQEHLGGELAAEVC
jgi:hypothetical protein